MNAIRLLHCADLHLGSEFSMLGDRLAGIRRVELENTWLRIVSICKEQSIPLMLIAGDFFDTVHISRDLLHLVRDSFASLGDTLIAVSAGNHDPLTVDSPWLLEHFWPDNVLILKNMQRPIEPEHLGVRLWGCGFTGPYEDVSLLATGRRAPADDRINICVMHGTVSPGGRDMRYNPLTEQQLAESGMDYVALGHSHRFEGVQRAGNTCYAWPGCPEGRGFDETGEKGILVGSVARGACSMTFLPTAGRSYQEMRIDVSDCTGFRPMADRIRTRLMDEFGETYPKHLYRITLTGALSEDCIPDQDAIYSILSDLFHLTLQDDTDLLIDLDSSIQDLSLRGIFTRRMMEYIQHAPDDPAARKALKLGLRAFSGKVDYHAD